MSRRKVGATVYLTDEQINGLRLLSEKTRVPFSVFVREGIDLILEKYGAAVEKPIEEPGDSGA